MGKGDGVVLGDSGQAQPRPESTLTLAQLLRNVTFTDMPAVDVSSGNTRLGRGWAQAHANAREAIAYINTNFPGIDIFKLQDMRPLANQQGGQPGLNILESAVAKYLVALDISANAKRSEGWGQTTDRARITETFNVRDADIPVAMRLSVEIHHDNSAYPETGAMNEDFQKAMRLTARPHDKNDPKAWDR